MFLLRLFDGAVTLKSILRRMKSNPMIKTLQPIQLLAGLSQRSRT